MALSSSGVTCDCGFLADIRYSTENNPDPITQIALHNITRENTQEFIQHFDVKIQQIGLTQKALRRHEIKERIHDTLLNTSTLATAMRGSRESSMKDFLRITLCYVQWEHQRRISTLIWTEKILEGVMQHLKRTLHRIEPRSLDATEYASRLLYWRNGFDRMYTVEGILRSVCNSYDQRCGQALSSKRISQILVLLDKCSRESNQPFHPSILAARCVVWIYSRLLVFESILLLGSSTIIHKTFRYCWIKESLSLPFRIATVAFVPSLVMGRMTMGLIQDAAGLFSENKPLYAFAAACRVLEESRMMSLEFARKKSSLKGYRLDLTPQYFFQYSIFTSQAVLDDWLEKYRQQLEHSFCLAEAILFNLLNRGMSGEELEKAVVGIFKSLHEENRDTDSSFSSHDDSESDE